MNNKILDFIKKSVDEDSFERMQYLNDDCGFNDYVHFIEHNKNCLENLSSDDISFVFNLKKMIENNRICNRDEESIIEWNTTKIYFNKDKKIVVMNDR